MVSDEYPKVEYTVRYFITDISTYLHTCIILTADIVYMVPKSNALVVVDKGNASFYHLVEATWPLILVTLAYQLRITNETPEDILAGK